MLIRLQRLEHYEDYTIGAMYIDGKMICFTLEDEKRTVKVYGESRIPSGLYNIRLQTAGRMSPRYAKKFPFHRGMLHIQDVKGFEGIFIHVGNTDEDTHGCILLGTSHNVGNNFIGGSVNAYSTFYPIVANEISKGQKVQIQVVDELIG